MNILSEAFNGALANALQGDQVEPLSREDLAAKGRPEIESAVLTALSSSAVAEALAQPELFTMLLLDMARAGKRDQVLGAIQRGADVHATTPAGQTALVLAAEARSAPAVRVLLFAKADVDVQAPGVGSVLHVAATREDEATFLECLDFGADPYRKNAEGLDAFEVMSANHMEPCTRLRRTPTRARTRAQARWQPWSRCPPDMAHVAHCDGKLWCAVLRSGDRCAALCSLPRGLEASEASGAAADRVPRRHARFHVLAAMLRAAHVERGGAPVLSARLPQRRAHAPADLGATRRRRCA